MVDVVQGFPQLPGPLVDESGHVTGVWRYFFVSLWNRTGQGTGALNLQASLDAISSTPGALLYRTLAQWQGLTGSTNQVLKFGAAVPTWGLLDALNFNTQSANRVLAGPTSGPNATPSFRSLVNNDIPVITDSSKIPIKPATVGTSLTATGSNQSDALILTNQWNLISTVAAGTGVRLDNASIGVEIVIFNRGANTLNIYPAVGSQINALGVNNPITLAVDSKMSLYPVTSTQLYGV